MPDESDVSEPATPPETSGIDLARAALAQAKADAKAKGIRRTERTALRRGDLAGQRRSSAHPDDRDPQLLGRSVERLIEELDFHEVLTERVCFAVEFKEGGGWCGRVAFMDPTASFRDITAAGKALLVEACGLGKRITGMHLLADQLCDRRSVQRSLFPNVDPAQAEQVADLKRSINDRMGRFAVRSGQHDHRVRV